MDQTQSLQVTRMLETLYLSFCFFYILTYLLSLHMFHKCQETGSRISVPNLSLCIFRCAYSFMQSNARIQENFTKESWTELSVELDQVGMWCLAEEALDVIWTLDCQRLKQTSSWRWSLSTSRPPHCGQYCKSQRSFCEYQSGIQWDSLKWN